VRPIGSRAFEHSSIISERCGQAQHQLDAHATILGNTVQYCETLSLIGYPAEVIVDEARRREVDLIVMATHGYSGLKRWALGSVADKVLHTTQTPLLLVRVKQTKA
jgi:nucleotide-binding universal stress UspA family protein